MFGRVCMIFFGTESGEGKAPAVLPLPLGDKTRVLAGGLILKILSRQKRQCRRQSKRQIRRQRRRWYRRRFKRRFKIRFKKAQDNSDNSKRWYEIVWDCIRWERWRLWEGMEMGRGWITGKEERSDFASPSSLFSYIFFLYSYYVVLLTPLFWTSKNSLCVHR